MTFSHPRPPSPLANLPDSATSAMGTPCSYAMKPRTEKMAKPATKLVPLLRQQSMMQSLRGSSERGRGQVGRTGAPLKRSAEHTADPGGRQGRVGTDSPIRLRKPLWSREVRWLAPVTQLLLHF